MTEYDYSPEAMRAHLAKQAKISQWASQTTKHERKHGHLNPFTPSATARRSDFYSKPSTPSEIYGPDRPPSPPRTAPPVGYGAGYTYGYPTYGYGAAGGAGQYGGGYTSSPGPSTSIQPTWNGHAWVYNTTPAPQPQQRDSIHHHDSGRRHHRHSSTSHRERQRRSVSSPPSPLHYGYTSPPVSAPGYQTYDMHGVRFNVVSPNGGQSQPVYGGQTLRSPGHPHRSWSLGSSAQVIYAGYGYGQPQIVSSPPPVVIVDGARRKSGKIRKDRN